MPEQSLLSIFFRFMVEQHAMMGLLLHFIYIAYGFFELLYPFYMYIL